MTNLAECKQQKECPNCMLRTDKGHCTILERKQEFSKPCPFYKTIEQADEQDANVARFYRNNPDAVIEGRRKIAEANEKIALKHKMEG